MEKVITGVLVVCFAIAIVLGVYWLIWSLWTWVMPQLWPTGPENLVNPGFWLFSGAFLLLSLVGGAIFGRSKGD